MSYDFDRMRALCVEEEYFECEMGMNLKARVTKAPVLKAELMDGKQQIEWEAVNTVTLEPIHYLATEGLTHYGPHLYDAPQYLSFKGDGTFYHRLLGEE